MIDKKFKNKYSNCDFPKEEKENEKSNVLTYSQMKHLQAIISDQNNEILTQIMKIILDDCPNGLVEKDNNKLLLEIQLLNLKAD